MTTATLAKPEMPQTAMRAAFVEWFGLERQTARILVELFITDMPAGSSSIAASVGSPTNAISYHIHRLRRALDPEAIDFAPCIGYSLTDEGRAECRAVLWTIGEELRRVR